MSNQTLAIIKPDAVKKGFSGDIVSYIEKNNITIREMRKIMLSLEEARNFYGIHKERSWFNELVTFMISGPIIVMVLEMDNAVIEWRNLMGTTNPLVSPRGTLRKMFGSSVGENALHGSDSDENAKNEINFFFKK